MAKILIIEDDPLIIKIYATRLISDGYEVISANNGEEGLKLAETKLPDLVLLDMMMPKMDGFEVLERIRTHEKLRQIPILIYSNLAQDGEISRALKLGATEFIVKANLSPTEMISQIKQYLTKKSPKPTTQVVSSSAASTKPAPMPAQPAVSKTPPATKSTAQQSSNVPPVSADSIQKTVGDQSNKS